ncbi:unknown [[Mannheimia] succiniciproducens MBEL55E]|uniref:Uncharacterized protein n=1 Tax=Mannheimia succiniciproducens (strain KCTC 0769BP / MBEL55E) TaxID=221988 RepID=Q65RN6_MANSM|nr:unknown [[Mannheimia] succiniciproducens MBEL55E]
MLINIHYSQVLRKQTALLTNAKVRSFFRKF